MEAGSSRRAEGDEAHEKRTEGIAGDSGVALAVIGIAAFHVGQMGGLWAAGMVMFLFCVMGVAWVRAERGAFWLGLGMGMGCYSPHLFFFVGVFGAAAISLWLILSVWVGLFTWMVHRVRRQVPGWAMMMVLPIMWTGFEYLRCEWNPLRFGWLTPGMAYPPGELMHALGVYGIGFAMALAAAVAWMQGRWRVPLLMSGLLIVTLTIFAGQLRQAAAMSTGSAPVGHSPLIVGIQMEHPQARYVAGLLDKARAAHPQADLFILSEYTYATPPPDDLLLWCKIHQTYVIVGGIRDAPGPGDRYYDTAFVIGPAGTIVFEQGKSQPIQFMQDGLPAKEQRLWDSPWGKIGICVCYDLSYTRIVDRLVAMGAQGIIVPTMDVQSWGRAEHELHARVGPVRASEYGIPVVRVCSSGISQIVDSDGRVTATADFPGQGALLVGMMNLAERGHLPADRYAAPACSLATLAYTMVAIAEATYQRIRRGGRRKGTPAAPTQEGHENHGEAGGG